MKENVCTTISLSLPLRFYVCSASKTSLKIKKMSLCSIPLSLNRSLWLLWPTERVDDAPLHVFQVQVIKDHTTSACVSEMLALGEVRHQVRGPATLRLLGWKSHTHKHCVQWRPWWAGMGNSHQWLPAKFSESSWTSIPGEPSHWDSEPQPTSDYNLVRDPEQGLPG